MARSYELTTERVTPWATPASRSRLEVCVRRRPWQIKDKEKAKTEHRGQPCAIVFDKVGKPTERNRPEGPPGQRRTTAKYRNDMIMGHKARITGSTW